MHTKKNILVRDKRAKNSDGMYASNKTNSSMKKGKINESSTGKNGINQYSKK